MILKEDLIDLYVNKKLTTRNCGKELGVSHMTIQKFLKLYNIPIRTKSESQKGKIVSEKTRLKQSLKKKGIKLSEERINKLKNKTPWNKNKGNVLLICKVCNSEKIVKPYRNSKFCSKNCKNKYSNLMRGETHWNYKGKESRNEQTKRNWAIYKEFKKLVHIRDNNKCFICKKSGKNDVHHIEAWTNNFEKRFSIENGITVCKNCHLEIHKTCGFKNYSSEKFKESYLNGNSKC